MSDTASRPRPDAARSSPAPVVKQTASIWSVVSASEARLVFWLVVIALVAVIWALVSGPLAALAPAAIILFVAWLMAYVLDPAIGWLRRHLPFRGRGVSVAIIYVTTVAIAFVVLLAAGVALLNAAVAFVDNLPEILRKVGDVIRPIIEALGIKAPSTGDVTERILEWLSQNAGAISDAVTAALGNAIGVVAGLFTAVVISVGIAVGQLSLLGWLRPFLPSSTYADLAGLEQAIAVSFGGFIRGRVIIGAVFGLIIAVTAFVLGVPYGPLIGMIAGMIVFIPWIGPLLGWAVLPAFALVLAPDVLLPALVVSIAAAVLVQVVVTQLVMGAAVNMSPVAVFAVVLIGTTIAGIIGAIFAIPTAAAILSIAEYLRRRDMLVRAPTDEASPPSASEPTTMDAGPSAAAPETPTGDAPLPHVTPSAT